MDEAHDEYLLARLRESYEEVLAATTHEDDKVGRFLAAIAFLVAGALFFAQQAEALQAHYDLGIELALPALSLVVFLFTITLAVLKYLLAISAPVTIPPGGESKRSHMFFLLIAKETEDSWRALWNRPKEDLRRELIEYYRVEILNLGQRAHNKRRRSEEASALFVVALLFFGLTVGFAIDAIVHDGAPQWALRVRVGVAAWLAAFAALLVYQRYRGRAVRAVEFQPRDERLRGFGWIAVGLAGTIALLLLPDEGLTDAWRGVLGVAAVVGVGAAASGLRSVTTWAEQPHAVTMGDVS